MKVKIVQNRCRLRHIICRRTGHKESSDHSREGTEQRSSCVDDESSLLTGARFRTCIYKWFRKIPLHYLYLFDPQPRIPRLRRFVAKILFKKPSPLSSTMPGKRHNRKRTRSRPRHRDAGNARSNHIRTYSMDTDASFPTNSYSSFQPSNYLPISSRPADHWDQMYSAWQKREQLRRHEEEQHLETRRLQFYGGEPGDETSLFEPMLRVVTDLFDGDIDYEDP